MLYLDGKAVKLDELIGESELAKYSKDMVFRVGKQHVQPVRLEDRAESPMPLWVAPVHVPCTYMLYKKENGMRKAVGQLIYAESANPRPDISRDYVEYQPPRIEIGTLGYLSVSQYKPDLNFFLDNHPLNEVVLNDPLHPNHDPNRQSVFATYSETRVAERLEKELELAFSIESKLRERDNSSTYVMNHSLLMAISATLLVAAHDKSMAVPELGRYDQIPEKVLRDRLIAVARRYPSFVKEAIEAHGVNYRAMINIFKEAGIIRLDGNQWIHQKNKTEKSVIGPKVPQGKDADESLYIFFKDRDIQNKVFNEVRKTYQRQQEKIRGDELAKDGIVTA